MPCLLAGASGQSWGECPARCTRMGLWVWCPCSDGPNGSVVPGPTSAASSGSVGAGDKVLALGMRCCPKGWLLPLSPSRPASICPAGDTGLAVLAGECITRGCGERNGDCFWVADASLNICHVLALITVMGC